MPSGLRKTSSTHFEIYYEQPWGGVASDKDPVDIADNQLVVQDGAVVVDNVLCYLQMIASTTDLKFFPATGNSLIYLIFQIAIENVVGRINAIYNYAVDQFGYVYQCGIDITQPQAFKQVAHNVDYGWPANFNEPTAVQVVNGKAYISVLSANRIFVFDPVALTIVTATTYTAGQVMGVLDDYLLTMNTFDSIDGKQSNRVNWSGPGKFTTWDPAIDRTAGFNTLAATNDEITGFISLASTGLIVSSQGLTQMAPTGIGIQPFSFTSLWTSTVGQGSLYLESVAQYGQRTFMVSDTGVFSISSASGLQDIGAIAVKAIMSSIQAPTAFLNTLIGPVAGGVMLYANNSTYPTPFYILSGFSGTPQVGGAPLNVRVHYWLLDLRTGIWQTCSYLLSFLATEQYGVPLGTIYAPITNRFAVINMPNDSLIPSYLPTLVSYMNVVIDGVSYNLRMLPTIFNAINDPNVELVAGSLNLVFKAQEIKIDRQPTIRRVVIRAYGSGTLACSISGVSFGNIILDGTNVAKVYKSPTGICTDEAPQLTITSANFKGVIIKVMLAGTYADGDIN